MATHSYGTQLDVNHNDDGMTYVEVAEIIDVGGMEKTTSEVKTSHLKSTDRYHTYIAGMREGGSVEFRIQYFETQFATLDTYFETSGGSKVKKWKVTLPDSSTWVFNGFISALKPCD